MPPQLNHTLQQNEMFCIGKDLRGHMHHGLMHLHRYNGYIRVFKRKSYSTYQVCSSLVGDNWDTLCTRTISCICGNYLSNDRIFLDFSQGVMVFLFHVLHIVVLHIYGDDDCFIHAYVSSSCNSTVFFQHYFQPFFRIYYSSTSKLYFHFIHQLYICYNENTIVNLFSFPAANSQVVAMVILPHTLIMDIE